MKKQNRFTAAVEIREQGGAKRLSGTILQEGRVASERAEVFAPNSLNWPARGIGITVDHGGAVEARALPARAPNGEISISTLATQSLIDAVAEGRDKMSIEFYALKETRNASNVRELQSAFVDKVALVKHPEFTQTKVEIRSRGRRRRRRLWL